MSTNEEKLLDFCTITGHDIDNAKHILEATDWNLEQAITLSFETGGDFGSSTTNQPRFDQSPEPVRAPIPQMQGRLVDQYQSFPQQYGLNYGDQDNHLYTGFNPHTSRLMNNVKKDVPLNRFEQIFAPPTDIMFNGTLESAREVGAQESKWLLVNIQSTTEFGALKLNRDVWSDEYVKGLVQAYFVFIQMDENDPESKRFVSFYNVDEIRPQILILDPRTGEMAASWKGDMDKNTVLENLQRFVEKFQVSPMPKSKESFSPTPKRKMDDVIEEDDELELAIAESLKQQVVPEKTVPIVQKSKYIESYEKWYSSEKGTSTRVQVRFPNGKREVLNILLSTPNVALYSMIHSKLDSSDSEKDFVILFANKTVIENTDAKTIDQSGISGSSVSIMFE